MSSLPFVPRALAYLVGLVLAMGASPRVDPRSARAVTIAMAIGLAATLAGVALQAWMFRAIELGTEPTRIGIVTGVLGMARNVVEAGVLIALVVIALRSRDEPLAPR
jgi:hypothetical protein